MLEIENIISILSDKKAEDVVRIDLKDAFVDHMIIATAQSGRQLGTLSDALSQYAKSQGLLPIVDGDPQCDWIVVDLGSTLVHLFKPEARTYYNIEKMWGFDASHFDRPTQA